MTRTPDETNSNYVYFLLPAKLQGYILSSHFLLFKLEYNFAMSYLTLLQVQAPPYHLPMYTISSQHLTTTPPPSDLCRSLVIPNSTLIALNMCYVVD